MKDNLASVLRKLEKNDTKQMLRAARMVSRQLHLVNERLDTRTTGLLTVTHAQPYTPTIRSDYLITHISIDLKFKSG